MEETEDVLEKKKVKKEVARGSKKEKAKPRKLLISSSQQDEVMVPLASTSSSNSSSSSSSNASSKPRRRRQKAKAVVVLPSPSANTDTELNNQGPLGPPSDGQLDLSDFLIGSEGCTAKALASLGALGSTPDEVAEKLNAQIDDVWDEIKKTKPDCKRIFAGEGGDRWHTNCIRRAMVEMYGDGKFTFEKIKDLYGDGFHPKKGTKYLVDGVLNTSYHDMEGKEQAQEPEPGDYKESAWRHSIAVKNRKVNEWLWCCTLDLFVCFSSFISFIDSSIHFIHSFVRQVWCSGLGGDFKLTDPESTSIGWESIGVLHLTKKGVPSKAKKKKPYMSKFLKIFTVEVPEESEEEAQPPKKKEKARGHCLGFQSLSEAMPSRGS
jgi:hypothetical protein